VKTNLKTGLKTEGPNENHQIDLHLTLGTKIQVAWLISFVIQKEGHHEVS
jgi:hypothetical protein